LCLILVNQYESVLIRRKGRGVMGEMR